MKFISLVALAALSGAASTAYAKETSASIIVSDSHISAWQATEEPLVPGVRRQLRKLLVSAKKANSESAFRLDAKEEASKESSGVRRLQAPTSKQSSGGVRRLEAPTNKPSKASKETPAPTSDPTPAPTPDPTPKPSPGPTRSPSLKPSAIPSAKPSDKPSLAPSGAPSEAPTPHPTIKKTQSPTTEAQGGFTGGINVEQCALTAPDYCVCGDCNEGSCDYSSTSSNKVLAICLKPAENSCGATDILTVTASPDKGCEGELKVTRNAQPNLCQDGWYVTKDLTNCQQQFVNNYSVKTPCVNNNIAVDIHTSCSCELKLCMDFNGFFFTGYNVPSQGGDTWIVPADECAPPFENGPDGCSANPPSPTPPSPSPPCTAPETKCKRGNCSDCCSGSVNCKGGNKFCGSETQCNDPALFERA